MILERDDLNYVYNTENIIEILKLISNECFIPVTFGEGINNIKQISEILRNGADKVSINTSALNNKNFLKSSFKKIWFSMYCCVN